MKITKTKLKQIIKEEVEVAREEESSGPVVYVVLEDMHYSENKIMGIFDSKERAVRALQNLKDQQSSSSVSYDIEVWKINGEELMEY